MTNIELDAMRAVIRLAKIADEIAGSLNRIADALKAKSSGTAGNAVASTLEKTEKSNDPEKD